MPSKEVAIKNLVKANKARAEKSKEKQLRKARELLEKHRLQLQAEEEKQETEEEESDEELDSDDDFSIEVKRPVDKTAILEGKIETLLNKIQQMETDMKSYRQPTPVVEPKKDQQQQQPVSVNVYSTPPPVEKKKEEIKSYLRF